MIEFKVSAPGKVILYGEHAVVYGKTAVAASLNLRTTIKFAELLKSPDLEDVIKIEFPNVNLSLTLPLRIFQNFFSDNFNDIKDSDQLRDHVKDFVDSIKNVIDKSDDDTVIKKKKMSLQAFFYLLVYIAREEHLDINTSFHVHLSTELQVSSGLGSSASFAVCLAACFLHWSLLQKGEHCTFTKDELDKISKYALNCEKIMHESPSGIDNSVCTYGSVIKFQNKELVDMLPHIPNLKILLVDSNVLRSTKDQVMRGARRKHLYPSIVDPILNSIDALSSEAWEVLKEMSSKADESTKSMEQEWYTKLSILVDMNHGLLTTLDVSHVTLEMIRAIAYKHSYAAKLTGAGGGGYAYILLLPDSEIESIKLLSRELEEKNFHVTMTSLGGGGVKIND